jgi:hypothetical protein
MNAGQVITGDEFMATLRGCRASAFHMETRDSYAVTFEQDAYHSFLRGAPLPPEELDWWRSWLDDVGQLAARGTRIGRVRVVADPPTDYQRWEMWGTPWHTAAGEQILYLPRQRAAASGIPLGSDWWLLDDEYLITNWFTDTGEPDFMTLTSDPALVDQHRKWRDLAVRDAVPVEQLAAA